MNHAVFSANVCSIVENYWRTKAALHVIKPDGFNGIEKLTYKNVPQFGHVVNLLREESISDAIASLKAHAADRLTNDAFTVLIGEFESRLNSVLLGLGSVSGGTLGTVQKRVQLAIALPPHVVEDIDEVRERRNAVAHHNGIASQKYVDAALKLAPRNMPFVPSVPLGTDVSPSGGYLTHCANVMVEYSRHL